MFAETPQLSIASNDAEQRRIRKEKKHQNRVAKGDHHEPAPEIA